VHHFFTVFSKGRIQPEAPYREGSALISEMPDYAAKLDMKI